jgi:hypothetical protein
MFKEQYEIKDIVKLALNHLINLASCRPAKASQGIGTTLGEWIGASHDDPEIYG